MFEIGILDILTLHIKRQYGGKMAATICRIIEKQGAALIANVIRSAATWIKSHLYRAGHDAPVPVHAV